VHRAGDGADVAGIARAHKHQDNPIGNVLRAHSSYFRRPKGDGPDATVRAVSSVP
jgi:hypothetical protein